MLLICREFHWTVQEYLETDAEIIDMLQQMLAIEAEETERQRAKAERDARLNQATKR